MIQSLINFLLSIFAIVGLKGCFTYNARALRAFFYSQIGFVAQMLGFNIFAIYEDITSHDRGAGSIVLDTVWLLAAFCIFVLFLCSAFSQRRFTSQWRFGRFSYTASIFVRHLLQF
jgi:hypothetical protein